MQPATSARRQTEYFQPEIYPTKLFSLGDEGNKTTLCTVGFGRLSGAASQISENDNNAVPGEWCQWHYLISTFEKKVRR